MPMPRMPWGGPPCPVVLGLLLACLWPRAATAYLQAFFPEWNHQQVDLSAAKAEFLERSGIEYGYDGLLDRIRAKDMPHLGDGVYLDWTGSALYRASQVDAMAADLKDRLYGNTHSENPSSLMTERRVQEVRETVVRFFNTR